MRKFLTAALVASVFVLPGCKPQNSASDLNSNKRGADSIPQAMLPDNVTPKSYHIDLTMNPDDDGYKGHVEIDIDVKNPTHKIWLHAKNMQVDGATIQFGGQSIPLTFLELPADQAPSGIAYVTAETEIPKGEATLSIPFKTTYNLSLQSAYKVERGDDDYIVTQFEPLGAREAFPSFDEPRFKVPFKLTITSPADDFVYANTPEISSATLDNGWIRHEFAKTPPLPTYLVAFGAGPYDVVEFGELPPNRFREHPIPLRGITAKGSGQDIQYALSHTQDILEILESYFGIGYPYKKLDLIAAPDYAYGAMENPGAIVYREYVILVDEDSPLTQKRSYAGIHAHEIAHQWFGNLVTPYWWEDIWLNEAFATWMASKTVATWRPEEHFDQQLVKAALNTMGLDSLKSSRKIRQPLTRSEDVFDQFDSITYRKGGAVLSMFESYLGKEAFQAGVRLHMDRFSEGVATADDFFQSLADGSKNSEVVPAMKSFVDQTGLPLVTASLDCDGEFAKINLTQTRYIPLGSTIKDIPLWQIPVCVRAGYSQRNEKFCTLMKDKSTTLSTNHKSCPDWIMPNKNGAGYYRFALADADWRKLISHSDQLNVNELLALEDSLEAALKTDNVSPEDYLSAMTRFANDPDYDVVSRSGDMLSWFHTYLPSVRTDISRLTRDMFAERFDAVRDADTIEGQLLAPELAQMLLNYGGDNLLKADFAEKGAAYLGLDRAANKSAIDNKMLGLALSEVMQARGKDAMDPLFDLVKNGSALEKGAAVQALASTQDLDLARTVLERALNDEKTITGRQALTLVSLMVGVDEVGEQSWKWLKDHFDTFATKRVPDVRRPGLPSLAPGCSKAARDETSKFFTDHAEIIPGYERSLEQRLESIELCAAFKAREADKLEQALRNR